MNLRSSLFAAAAIFLSLLPSSAQIRGFSQQRLEDWEFSKDGKIITLSMAGDPDENEAILKKLNPLLIEKFPQTLEEIFLDEMEGTDYDFKEIFG